MENEKDLLQPEISEEACAETAAPAEPEEIAKISEERTEETGVEYVNVNREADGPDVASWKQKLKALSRKWWFWAILAVVALVLVLGLAAAASDEGDSGSGGGSSAYSAPVVYEHPYVTIVKTTENSKYGVTYGAAFNSFFTSPKWSYFSATTGEDVVEFEGGFLYDGSPATATFQIVVDMDEGMLTVHHLSINGVGQSNLMLATMLQKVFESY